LRGTINVLRLNFLTNLAAMMTIAWIWMGFTRLRGSYESLRLQF
jgi:hypothetical protein